MGFTQSLPELEVFLDAHARSWRSLADHDYSCVVEEWSTTFRGPVERRERHLSGIRALDEFRRRLPTDVTLLSGVRIPQVGNLGGRGPAAYRVTELDDLDPDLGRALELVVVAPDSSWCLLLSHETGSWCHEEFWIR